MQAASIGPMLQFGLCPEWPHVQCLIARHSLGCAKGFFLCSHCNAHFDTAALEQPRESSLKRSCQKYAQSLNQGQPNQMTYWSHFLFRQEIGWAEVGVPLPFTSTAPPLPPPRLVFQLGWKRKRGAKCGEKERRGMASLPGEGGSILVAISGTRKSWARSGLNVLSFGSAGSDCPVQSL